MKKFITVSPFQAEKEGGLNRVLYDSSENERLKCDIMTCYPIIPVINGYTEKGDKIQVIIVVFNYSMSNENAKKIKQDVIKLASIKEFEYEFVIVDSEYKENIDSCLNLFSNLLNYLNDGDQLHACISFGTKPTPIVEMMALNYAFRAKQNVTIECIAYGKLDFDNKKSYINDITALFYMDEIVNNLAKMHVKNPEEKIRHLLEM